MYFSGKEITLSRRCLGCTIGYSLLEEKTGQLDYKGKIRQKQRYADAEQFLTIQFEWHGQEKFVSSTLIGTSPEFEMALLTMCFF